MKGIEQLDLTILKISWSLFDVIAEAFTKDKPPSLYSPIRNRLLWVMNGYRPIPFPYTLRLCRNGPLREQRWKLPRIEVMESLKPPCCCSGCSLLDALPLVFHPNWFLRLGISVSSAIPEITSWFSLILKLSNLLNSKRFSKVAVLSFITVHLDLFFHQASSLFQNKLIWFSCIWRSVKMSCLLLNRWKS